MDGYTTYSDGTVAYDPAKDGVWLLSGGQAVLFLNRYTIIQMVSALAEGPALTPNTGDENE
ncbi:MAG: hypothetical protein VX464_11540 [Pseudomonadota bacterium]|nr:hypothetical protein [Pseudomonadota bacterium]